MYNKCIVIGNLTRDPELRSVNTANGAVSVCNFTVATNDFRQPRRNNEIVPQFFRVAVWREHGEKCHQYLSKGRAVQVEGCVSLSVDEVDGRTYANLEIQNAQVTFLPDGRNNAQQNGGAAIPHANTQGARAATSAQPAAMPNYDAQPAAPADAGVTQVDDDELPF